MRERSAAKVRAEYTDAFVTAHLEVPGEMFALALQLQAEGRGVVGSTSNILGFIRDKLDAAVAAPIMAGAAEGAISWAKENVSKDDQWVHQLVVNSAMAELRVFAFQTKETIDEPTEFEKFEEWINERVL